MKVKANMRIVDHEKLFAIGDVTLDDFFVIHQVKVLIGEDGKGIVHLPRKQGNEGWRNIIHINDKKLLGEIKQAVFESVKEASLKTYSWQKEGLQITVRPYSSGNLCGYAKISYLDMVEIDGIQIRKKGDRLAVVYPYELHGEHIQSLVSPSDVYARDSLQDSIIEVYQAAVAEKNVTEPERGQNHERSK